MRSFVQDKFQKKLTDVHKMQEMPLVLTFFSHTSHTRKMALNFSITPYKNRAMKPGFRSLTQTDART